MLFERSRSTSTSVTFSGAEAEAVVRHPDRLDPEALEERDLGLGVADPRNPVQEQLLLGQKAGGEDRQGGVLVARSGDLAAERRPSLDDEFLHGFRLG